MFWPLHLQPALLSKRSVYYQAQLLDKEKAFPVLGKERSILYSFPNAERYALRSFYIPSGIGMSGEELEMAAGRIIRVAEEIVKEFGVIVA